MPGMFMRDTFRKPRAASPTTTKTKNRETYTDNINFLHLLKPHPTPGQPIALVYRGQWFE